MQFSISQQSPEGKDELEMIQIMNIKTLNASFTQTSEILECFSLKAIVWLGI